MHQFLILACSTFFFFCVGYSIMLKHVIKKNTHVYNQPPDKTVSHYEEKTVLKMRYVFTVTECFDFAVSGNSSLTDFRVYIKIYYYIRHTENNPVMPHNRNWNQPIPIFSTASSTV